MGVYNGSVMKESARYIVQILVFVALILSCGTVGYLVIEEDISFANAFYTTLTAITPAQFDEVHELSIAGRYFTVVLVFCGFGAVVAFASQFARLIIQYELEGVGIITREQMRRRIRRMKNHYIVCGYGEIGGAICGELRDQRLPFVVITNDDVSVEAVHREGHAVVRGNPTADSSLKDAGIEQAVGVIAVLADDADNLFISLAARELNPTILIIARGEDASVEDRMLRAGADIVVSPMQLGGRQIAELIKQQAGTASPVQDNLSQSSVLGMRLTVYRHEDDNPISVKEVLARLGGIAAAGIQRYQGELELNASADAQLRANDVLVLVTRTSETAPATAKRPTGKTILLADDHRALRLLFARKLAAAGHNVIQAASGDEALRQSRSHTLHLVVLDVNMPNRNGYEVCAELRKSPHREVPIILYSGEETDGFVQRGKEAGASLCIRKTSKSSELLARIEELFSGQTPAKARSPASHASAPEPNPDSTSDAFDLETMLENVGGDRQLIDELVEVLLQESPALMDRIERAVSHGEADAMRVAAHTLKSSLAIVGAQRAQGIATQLESIAAQNDLTNAERLQRDLRSELERTWSALRKVTADCKDTKKAPLP